MSKLQAAIDAYNSLTNKEIIARQVSGILPEDKYQRCKNLLEDNELLIRHDDILFEVEFNLPSENNSLFTFDINDLLKAPSRLLSPPDNFYLADKDYLHTAINDSTPEEIKNYLNISLFANTLCDLADYAIKNQQKAIFLHGEKLELSLKYSSSDLKPLVDLDKFISDFVAAEIHKEQKITIIKSVLLEMLKNNEIDRLTLPCLINRFSEFVERVNANYQLYVSEFSFDKIKAQVESEKLEFTLKLNKVFSDIQNQLLAIPVALILIGGQVTPENSFTLKNISIWFGAIVFGIFMSLLIRNQRSTLKAIRLEMDSQWDGIKNKHKFVAERLGVHYAQLRARYWLQSFFLAIISTIISGSIVGATGLLLYSAEMLHVYSEVLVYGLYGGCVYLIFCWLTSFVFKIIQGRSLKCANKKGMEAQLNNN